MTERDMTALQGDFALLQTLTAWLPNCFNRAILESLHLLLAKARCHYLRRGIAAVSDLVGRTLGNYEILAEREQDELGTVYQARETLSGRLVSLRLLHRSWVDDDPSLRRRLALQVERLGRLSHPRVVRLLALEESERNLFLVSEWAEGQPLRERLRRQGALRPEQARQILQDVAAALDEAHRQGLVHGDVHPGNILLSADGHALLANTGIVWTVRPLAPRTPERGHTDRLLIGAPSSMAPEVVRGEKPTPASDLYALGVVLYEMLTGRPPFAGEEHELLWAQVHDTPPPPSRWNRHLPAQSDTVLAKALAKAPDARYATAARAVACVRPEQDGQKGAYAAGLAASAVPCPRRAAVAARGCAAPEHHQSAAFEHLARRRAARCPARLL